MRSDQTTLARFLIEERRRHADASGDLNALVADVALAVKTIAKQVAYGAIGDTLSEADTATVNVHGETQTRLDLVSNEIFVRANEWSGLLAGMVSEEMEQPLLIPEHYPKGKYLLLFDPLDGSSNLDINGSVGSIFSILRTPRPGMNATTADFFQAGASQVCAGYAVYGPSTILVVTVGAGVHGFTLDPQLGEFVLTHPSIRIPSETNEFAINASNSRFWEPAVQHYVEECIAGKAGPRGKDFKMRWVAALVGEAHRILMRGGVFLYPRDSRDPTRAGRLRLLYEVNPISLLVERAGGRASTGRERVLDVVPESLHQRIACIFGSSAEVERIERCHCEHNDRVYDAPLFRERGLFKEPTGAKEG